MRAWESSGVGRVVVDGSSTRRHQDGVRGTPGLRSFASDTPAAAIVTHRFFFFFFLQVSARRPCVSNARTG